MKSIETFWSITMFFTFIPLNEASSIIFPKRTKSDSCSWVIKCEKSQSCVLQ